MNRKVTMGMTDQDLGNTEYLQILFETSNKAGAVSTALQFTAEIFKMLRATGSTLKMHHQDGSVDTVTFENERIKRTESF
jgi:hypothetical protein